MLTLLLLLPLIGFLLLLLWPGKPAPGLLRQVTIVVLTLQVIGSVVVLMPPYCTTRTQLRRMVSALAEALEEVFPPSAMAAPGS